MRLNRGHNQNFQHENSGNELKFKAADDVQSFFSEHMTA